ncbi:MAG: hypothetical protein KGI53_14450 [Nitrospirota bacterium]|nr:hypothetical protein [Nitrospirota bacterium]
MTLNVQAMPGTVKKADSLTVSVGDFEDSRPDKSRVGVRHHLWGGETTFVVPGGKPEDVFEKVMNEYLKRRGWNVGGSNPSVTFSGSIASFQGDAESKVFNTEITVHTKVMVQGRNNADGSLVRMTITGDGTQRVFWFSPDDVQELLGEVLTSSLDKFSEVTKVENGQLRLK